MMPVAGVGRPGLLIGLILGAEIYSKRLAAQPSEEAPRFPEHIIRAWRDAGAEVGWIGRHSHLAFTYFNTVKDSDMVDAVPGFRIRGSRAGLLAQLPDPGIPFGLDLSGSNITNAGLKELAALKNLSTLDLRGTQITDAGLKELATLKSLRMLDVSGTEVTELGIAELLKALPHCEISNFVISRPPPSNLVPD